MSALRGKADISVNFSYWTKSDIDFIQMPNRWGRFGSRPYVDPNLSTHVRAVP